jgi:hypothetical protein
MNPTLLVLCIALTLSPNLFSQSNETTDHVIEGSKVIVELVKALSNKKGAEKEPGCKNHHADLCIENNSMNSMTVILKHRASGEKREVVILPKGKECALQVVIGVWNYDLRLTGTEQPLRKGDMLIKGCENMTMNIK